MKTDMIAFKALVIALFAIPFHSNLTCAESLHADAPVPYKSVTTQEESTIEKTAIIALRHISQARSDIRRKEYTTARHDLDEAAKLMDSIRDNLSTATVKSLIKIARQHLEYEPAQQVVHELSPIHSALDNISVYLPTDKAILHIGRAKSSLDKGDKRGADRELALADKSLTVIEVEVPLTKTQAYVTKAQGYLAAQNAVKADKALQLAEQRAKAIYSGAKSPLFHAKQTMWLAFRNYSSSSRAETESYLVEARKYLSKAETEGGAIAKEEVGKLRHEIEGLSKKLPAEGKVAESALKAAWKRSEALAERSVAYYSAGLSEAETTLGGEHILIEARMHVAFAETYQVTAAEPDNATREIDKAYSYIQKVTKSSLTGAADRMRLHRIGGILQALKATPEENDAAIQERYDTVKEELSDLIQKM